MTDNHNLTNLSLEKATSAGQETIWEKKQKNK